MNLTLELTFKVHFCIGVTTLCECEQYFTSLININTVNEKCLSTMINGLFSLGMPLARM
jgi:hypothetical protein